MMTATIKNETCRTIEDFYKIRVPKIKYGQTGRPLETPADFYREFLVEGNRLPQPDAVRQWHELLMWYIQQPDAVYFVRKYEAGKSEGAWNNRRGAVVSFADGFEIAYAGNFLAHEIFLMAYHGFVPDRQDFMDMIKTRRLHITSGTQVEKEIRTYQPSNKVLGYCYLAHIMDVNGHYLREDGSYRKISRIEEARLFPCGTAAAWTSSPDRIWHLQETLSSAEKELIKAHCLRFLDPMNYYLTPLTGQSTHKIPGFKKNIGEFACLTYYVQQQYRALYGQDYEDLIAEGKFVEKCPVGYTGTERIDLEYSAKSKKPEPPTEDEELIAHVGEFMREKSGKSEGTVATYLGRLSRLLGQLGGARHVVQEIDGYVNTFQKGGVNYREKDSGNTGAALGQLRAMLRYPYICYQIGYRSFCPQDEYVEEYCIDGNTITYAASCGFLPKDIVTKTIDKADMDKLIGLLEEAKRNDLFAKTGTNVRSCHGTVYGYEFEYGGIAAQNCRSLFNGKDPRGSRLWDEYNKLIRKLTV